MELQRYIGACEAIAAEVKSGRMDPLDAYVELKAMEGAVEDALEQVKEDALRAAQTYPGKTFEHHGLKFTRTDGKRMFKFDHLEDWVKADKAKRDIEERAKNAALQLEKNLIAATDSGEVLEPARVEFGAPSLSIWK
jgi:hypothetical protein